ncbi:hypothetical protein [Spiroplasma endosymbiont of Polydrusus pterygomalis]
MNRYKKMINFLGDHNKIAKIGVINILITGHPGTGKTSFVNKWYCKIAW